MQKKTINQKIHKFRYFWLVVILFAVSITNQKAKDSIKRICIICINYIAIWLILIMLLLLNSDSKKPLSSIKQLLLISLLVIMSKGINVK